MCLLGMVCDQKSTAVRSGGKANIWGAGGRMWMRVAAYKSTGAWATAY